MPSESKPSDRRAPITPLGEGGLEPLTPEVFAERLSACTGVLWTVAAGILGRREGVEDVLQEAALIGLQKLDRFEPGSNFVAWVARIVRFVALNRARRTARRRTHATGVEVLDQQPAEPSSNGASSSALEDAAADPASLGASSPLFDGELSAALDFLKPVARACLLMKAVLELEYREIAAVMELPEGTAMSHVHRARECLREQLSETKLGVDDGRGPRAPRSTRGRAGDEPPQPGVQCGSRRHKASSVERRR